MSSINGLIKMTKHEGNGNDFLVLLDAEDRFHFSNDAIRWLCDRRRGVGADGFIRGVGVTDEPAISSATGNGTGEVGSPGFVGTQYDAYMELTNADGTRAEMSGNGIRCLVQAIYDFRHEGVKGEGAHEAEPSTIRIATDAGLKDVVYQPGSHSGNQSRTCSDAQSGGDAWLGSASVSMGSVTVGDVSSFDFFKEIGVITDREAVWVDVGNPHLVLIGEEVAPGELEMTAPKIASLVPGGVNVEICWLDSSRKFAKHVQLYGNEQYDEWYGYAVYERGVGVTLSCGTGAVAVCAALRSKGRLSPDGSTVNGLERDDSMLMVSEGGPLEVIFNGAGAILRGPVSKVTDLYMDPRRLEDSFILECR